MAEHLPILLGNHQAGMSIGKHSQESMLKGIRLDHERGRKCLCQRKKRIGILWLCGSNARYHRE